MQKDQDREIDIKNVKKIGQAIYDVVTKELLEHHENMIMPELVLGTISASTNILAGMFKNEPYESDITKQSIKHVTNTFKGNLIGVIKERDLRNQRKS